jgi:DNA-binding MarR family transcriptional regulator
MVAYATIIGYISIMHQGEAETMRRVVHAFIRRFGLLDQAQTPCGMQLPLSWAHALMALLHSPSITQNELAEKLALSKSNISRLVARLVAAGRVKRRKDGDDGRAYRLELTAKGRRLAVAIDGQSLARFSAIISVLPARRRGAIIDALAFLVDATPPAARKSLSHLPAARGPR